MKFKETLAQMKESKSRYENLVASGKQSAARVKNLNESIARLTNDIATVEKWIINRPRPGFFKSNEASIIARYEISNNEFARVI